MTQRKYTYLLMTGFTLVVIMLSLVVTTLFAQEPATPTLQCGEIVIRDEDNQVTIPITVDFANNPIDTVRMEMVFDPATLSNPVAVKGADFNTNGIQAAVDNLFVATFGRSSMSDVEGSAHFATVTFDWTGEPTFVTFAELGQGIGQGTIAFIVGDKLPVDTTMCMIGENAPTPTPTNTLAPTNTPTLTPIPTNTPVPTNPKLQCGEIVTSDGQVTIPITIDLANNPIYRVHMEMLFDPDILSNPIVVKSDNFLPSVIQYTIHDNLVTAGYTRRSVAVTEGIIDFATVTFDWTGEPVFISFVEAGQSTTTAIGTHVNITGYHMPTETTMCMIGENAPTPTPTPSPTMTPTPTPLPLLHTYSDSVPSYELIEYTITLTDTVRSTSIVTATVSDGLTFELSATNVEESSIEQTENQIIWQSVVDPALSSDEYPAHLIIGAHVDADAYDVVTMSVAIDDGRTYSISIPVTDGYYLDEEALSIPDSNEVDFSDLPFDTYSVSVEGATVPDGYDYADLPDTYSTTGEGAPSHETVPDGSQIILGTNISVESDGQPSFDAMGDRDDGVMLPVSKFVAGETQVFEAEVTGDVPTEGAVLGVWIDWDHDGTFSETEFDQFNVTEGQATIPMTAPDVYEQDVLAVRFRLFAGDNLPGGAVDWTDFEGSAVNGEVEDYVLSAATAVSTADQSTTTHSTILNGVLLLGAVLLITMGVVRRGRKA